ncbi:glycosyltransferase family 2 protein [Enterococcus faecium]|uniref:glycosyltransferase family 2 protein n=1 Tax=Enterococcus faecium TaxID=1352 RepID=UPI0001B6E9D4|nr:glycosyltransferase family 2 protein [Enterococcus faecium]EEV49867.1 beta(1,3)galactosyltransferase [Enterococcus faecium 1,141,733]
MISVIMSVRNSSKELDSAIESILEQTYKNIEFIICNDGSEDDTENKLNKWEKKDKRIRLIKNSKNMGLAYSLNRCIEIAKGDYIARMDADDFSYPERLFKQKKFLDENLKYSFCSSNIDVFDGEKITLKNRKSILIPEKKDLVKQSCFVHPATMFRSEFIKCVGKYRVSKETTRAEDYDLFMRAYSMGHIGANINEPLLRYKMNLTDVKNKRRFKHRIEEIIVRYKGYNLMKIPKYKYYYLLRPIIAGLIPAKIMYKRHTKTVD